MKCLKALALLLLCGTIVFGQTSPIAKKVIEEQEKGAKFIKSHLFSQDKVSLRSSILDQYVDDYSKLSVNTTQLKDVIKQKHDALEIEIPYNNSTITLELVKADLYAEGFSVRTSESPNNPVPYNQGTFYQGIVKDSRTSIATLSLYEDEVIGIFETEELGNLVLGKFGAIDNDDYVVYQDSKLKIENSFVCETADPEWDAQKMEEIRNILENKTASIRADKCVNIYFELDYDLYKEKGSVSAATNYISGLFNSVQALYKNESIDVAISEIFVWNQNDNYGKSTTTSALTSFRNKRPTFNGDVAHLISRGAPANGGIAWVDALCTNYAYAYSWINSTYKNFPTYSWSVNVVTHETGHVLGSPHTHSCSWPGGPIDNCATPEPASGCSKGPAPSGGGTIMSYCHLTSYGIDFNKGFGKHPGDLIRARINASSCLSSCSGGTGTTPTCNDGIQNGNETGVDCGGGCTPCATCDDGKQNGNETGVDCGGDCTPCATCDDGIQNGNETGVDCGGSCAPCVVDVYCKASSSNTQYEHISNVTFAGINNSSGKDAYGNYVSQTASVAKGNTYNISITPAFSGAATPEHFAVFIDWNGDGDLTDAGERVVATTGNGKITVGIKIPTTAKNGTTRMRVAMQWNKAITNPCTNVSYGEIEDYSVKISGSGGTTPTCNDGVKNGTETGVDCGGSCTPCATCNDGVKNGNETGVDCGGDCGPCEVESGYCESKSTTTQYEYIKNVNFSDLDNSSKSNGGYANFTEHTANVSKGSTYTLKVTPGYNGSPYIEFINVYIDWNSDGDFKDNGETVMEKSGTAAMKVEVTIPNSAVEGTTRMRVQMQWNKKPTGPCSILSYGEVEDYSVNISGGNAPGCNDGVKNGNEAGVDCGGPCNPCSTCNDGVKNGNETGVDCGGDCAPCTTCEDGVKNGNETEVDCGGDCGPCQTQVAYCASSSNKTTYEWIKLVQLGSINNATGSDGGYGDYTNLSTNLQRGSSNSIALEPHYAGSAYSEGWNVYIDFNQDGDFDDTGEDVYKILAKNKVVGTITVPSNAKLGPTRMRIQMQWNKNTGSACDNFGWGEVEDYTVNIGGAGNLANNFSELNDPFDVTLFPNPVQDILVVKPQNMATGTIFVYTYDVVGKLIETKEIRGEERFDVSHFKPGYYLMKFDTGNEKITKQFIKK